MSMVREGWGIGTVVMPGDIATFAGDKYDDGSYKEYLVVNTEEPCVRDFMPLVPCVAVESDDIFKWDFFPTKCCRVVG